MFALLGFRFSLLMELEKIKKKINWLLDKYNTTNSDAEKKAIVIQLDKERVNLDNWKKEHGYG